MYPDQNNNLYNQQSYNLQPSNAPKNKQKITVIILSVLLFISLIFIIFLLEKNRNDFKETSNEISTASDSKLSQSKSEDSESKTDINAIHAQLETYYAINGTYPTLEQVNNFSWRLQNFKGLDDEALKTPKGVVSTLIPGDPTLDAYQYKADLCDSQNKCLRYELRALLGDNTKYAKFSLN
jgi:hypothetical protein